MTRANVAAELFGRRLRELRRKRKLTQGVIAERVACSQSHLSTIEPGPRVPNLLLISDLTRAFDNVDLAALLPDRNSRRKRAAARKR